MNILILVAVIRWAVNCFPMIVKFTRLYSITRSFKNKLLFTSIIIQILMLERLGFLTGINFFRDP